MKSLIAVMTLLLCWGIQTCLAAEVKIVNITFPGEIKPKLEVDEERNWYTNHFSTSASYKMEVEVEFDIPENVAFNVRVYAEVSGRRIALGDARIGRAQSTGPKFVSFYIFPSSANFFGQCYFVCVVDADNEISEEDESPISNEHKFAVTIHRPGEVY